MNDLGMKSRNIDKPYPQVYETFDSEGDFFFFDSPSSASDNQSVDHFMFQQSGGNDFPNLKDVYRIGNI